MACGKNEADALKYGKANRTELGRRKMNIKILLIMAMIILIAVFVLTATGLAKRNQEAESKYKIFSIRTYEMKKISSIAKDGWKPISISASEGQVIYVLCTR